MALAKSNGTVLASTSVAPGQTRTNATPSAAVSLANNYSTTLGWTITNGASPPGTPLALTFQQSPDGGTTWHDIQTVGGDTVASSVNSGTISIGGDISSVRTIAYGNTTNAVTAQADFTAKTSL